MGVILLYISFSQFAVQPKNAPYFLTTAFAKYSFSQPLEQNDAFTINYFFEKYGVSIDYTLNDYC